eukprot:7133876-Pyramimonas_sp.AAC.1
MPAGKALPNVRQVSLEFANTSAERISKQTRLAAAKKTNADALAYLRGRQAGSAFSMSPSTRSSTAFFDAATTGITG